MAIGDSTVEGLADPGADGVYIGWADRFAAPLNVMRPGLLYANPAVRGQTTREVRRGSWAVAGPGAGRRLVVAGVNDVLRPRPDRFVRARRTMLNSGSQLDARSGNGHKP